MEKIIKFKEEIKDIDFAHLDDRNNFDNEDLNKIICFKIDLLFEKHFGKNKKGRIKQRGTQ